MRFHELTEAPRAPKPLTFHILPGALPECRVTRGEHHLDEAYVEVRNERVQLLKNPLPELLISYCKRSKFRGLRGLVVGPDIYWWFADVAIHADIARLMGHDHYKDDRLQLHETVMTNGYQLDLPVALEPKITHHKQLQRLLNCPDIFVYETGQGTISGPEWLEQNVGTIAESRLTEGTAKMQSGTGISLNVQTNPSPTQVRAMLARYGELRGIIDRQGVLYLWDAHHVEHGDARMQLGIDPTWAFYLRQREGTVTYEFYDAGADEDGDLTNEPAFQRATKGLDLLQGF